VPLASSRPRVSGKEATMKEPTDEQKQKIEREALQILARFSEIVGSERANVEAILVAATAQTILAMSYFVSERSGDEGALAYFCEVGARLGDVVHRETLRCQSEVN
jgi:hypothetical protein